MAESIHRLNSSASDVSFKLSCESVLSNLACLDQSSIDSILEYNDPRQPHIVLPDGRQFVWYFAIGSMTNPISLHLRQLTPVVSYPVVCPDHEIVFRDNNGMADIEYHPGSEFDGVVHLLSAEQMAYLDQVEGFYHRMMVNVIDYQQRPHSVYAYKMNQTNQPANFPTERYLDIIVKGCEYHKVRREHIDRLKHKQPVIPRKQSHIFKSFSDVPSDIFYSPDELARHNGNDSTIPLWTSINGKILEYAGVPPRDHPDHESQKRFYTFFQPRYGGREMVYAMAKVLYEPLYKLPLNDDDMTDEHRAMVEDNFYDWVLTDTVQTSYWKPIGRLRQSVNK